jgi:hypothetical protein
VEVVGAAADFLFGVRVAYLGMIVGLLLGGSMGLLLPAFGIGVGLPVGFLGCIVTTLAGCCVGLSVGLSRKFRVGILVLSSMGFRVGVEVLFSSGL